MNIPRVSLDKDSDRISGRQTARLRQLITTSIITLQTADLLPVTFHTQIHSCFPTRIDQSLPDHDCFTFSQQMKSDPTASTTNVQWCTYSIFGLSVHFHLNYNQIFFIDSVRSTGYNIVKPTKTSKNNVDMKVRGKL